MTARQAEQLQEVNYWATLIVDRDEVFAITVGIAGWIGATAAAAVQAIDTFRHFTWDIVISGWGEVRHNLFSFEKCTFASSFPKNLLQHYPVPPLCFTA
jgi:hypothetical protein